MRGAGAGSKAGMVWQGGEALSLQPIGNILGFLTRQAINDASIMLVLLL